MSGAVPPADSAAPLAGVAVLLADEPAVRAASGGQGEAVAVGDAARPLFLAALARASARRPIVVAVPTATEAERIAHDLRQLLGAGAVEQFRAWETLPFERVSPALETMGRRMRVLWRLRTIAASAERGDPFVIVAPIRALVQRLGPHVADVEPVTVAPGGRLDRDEFVARLVELGYRREYQVEARGEVAVRGSIVDVYPVTADHPVRIDLWGDEVDRLTEFSIADQRATVECAAVTIFPAREILPTADVRARAAALITEHAPAAVALEESFVGVDARTALSVGQARGAVLVAAALQGVECTEYAPSRVKQAVCGYGRAEKAQVQRMVKAILGLQELPTPNHAADALAVAICHALAPPLLKMVG